MKHLKILGVFLLAIIFSFSLSSTLFAADDSATYTDVSDNAWYTDAIKYCQENGLMNGTSETTFTPNGSMTRAMLATALYRQTGSPTVEGSDNFTDTADGTWYTNAVLWAYQQKIITGYSESVFGTDNAII